MREDMIDVGLDRIATKQPTDILRLEELEKRSGWIDAFVNRAHGRIHVIMDRLPRLLTDQTATLPPVKSADLLEIMLPIIRKVQSAQASPKTARSGSTLAWNSRP